MAMNYSDMELAACQICFQEVETIEHVFLHCSLAQIIWKESPWPINTNAFCAVSMPQWIRMFCHPHRELGLDKCIERSFLFMGSYCYGLHLDVSNIVMSIKTFR